MLRRLRMRIARRILRLALLTQAAAQHADRVPDLSNTLTAETHFGSLYVHSGDSVVTPFLMRDGVWEAGETEFLANSLSAGMVFLDVGAHVGYFSVLAGRLVGPTGLVIAFEPEPRNFELLLANVWRNGLTNVVCFPWAVGEQSGFADLHLGGGNTGDHRLYPSDEPRDKVVVRVVALDDLNALRSPIDVVKIDIQGAEMGAVRGMERLLARSPNVTMTVEFWPFGMRFLGSDEVAALEYYRSLGFQVRVQDPEAPGVQDLSDEQIVELCRAKGGAAHTNLVLTRPA